MYDGLLWAARLSVRTRDFHSRKRSSILLPPTTHCGGVKRIGLRLTASPLSFEAHNLKIRDSTSRPATICFFNIFMYICKNIILLTVKSMKKVIYFLTALAVVAGLASCKCTKDEEPVVEFAEASIAADRANMDENFETYKWFETRAEYDNFFDADTTLTLNRVESLFQVSIEDSLGVKPTVYKFVHELGAEGDVEPEVVEGFVLDDMPLNDEQVTLTFSEALERLFEANLPKPHSTKVVLRKVLGPKAGINAHYIFGNTEEQVFVDAVTGDVTDKNPFYEAEEAE